MAKKKKESIQTCGDCLLQPGETYEDGAPVIFKWKNYNKCARCHVPKVEKEKQERIKAATSFIGLRG